jgi:hypothetical protein
MKIRKPVVFKGPIFLILSFVLLVFVLFVSAISVSGCLKKSSSVDTVNSAKESKVTEDAAPATGSKIPEGWPEVVPVNSSIEIQLSGAQKANDKTGWSVSGIFAGSGEELYKYYLNKLSGWKKDSDSVTGSIEQEKNYALSFSNEKYLTSIIISETKTEVKILLNVNEK